jgi:polysaccharide biosynthesis/export protein
MRYQVPFRSLTSAVAVAVLATVGGAVVAAQTTAPVPPQTQTGAPTPPAASAPAASPPAVEPPEGYVIGPDDVLGVLFWRDTEMTGDVTVRPDGKVTLPLLGDIQAAGLSPEALTKVIQEAASKFQQDPSVTIVVRQINSRKVFITGQVTNPGAFPLTGPRTVMQLIAVAGGLTEYADKKNITIVRFVNGQQQVFKFNYNDVARGKALAQNIVLQPGDTVVVP